MLKIVQRNSEVSCHKGDLNILTAPLKKKKREKEI